MMQKKGAQKVGKKGVFRRHGGRVNEIMLSAQRGTQVCLAARNPQLSAPGPQAPMRAQVHRTVLYTHSLSHSLSLSLSLHSLSALTLCTHSLHSLSVSSFSV